MATPCIKLQFLFSITINILLMHTNISCFWNIRVSDINLAQYPCFKPMLGFLKPLLLHSIGVLRWSARKESVKIEWYAEKTTNAALSVYTLAWNMHIHIYQKEQQTSYLTICFVPGEGFLNKIMLWCRTKAIFFMIIVIELLI